MRRAGNRARFGLVSLLLGLHGAGCAPTVRAGSYYAVPLERATRAEAAVDNRPRPAASEGPAIEARFRVLPPPSGCAPVLAPIVFLPALGLTQHSWAGVSAALGACRARVLVDAPGLGETPFVGAFDAATALAAIVAVVDAVAPGGRVVLAGHSLGGAMAARLAAQLGDRVEALVLVAAPLSDIALNRWEKLLLFDSLWPPLLHLAGAYSGIGTGLRRVSHGGAAIAPLDVALIAADWSDRRRRQAIVGYYREFLQPARLEENGAALDRVRAPTLLVWGDADDIVPPTVGEAAAARLARVVAVTTRVVPGVGHLVPLAAPGTVAQALDDFLAALPSATAVTVVARRSEVAAGARSPGDRVWHPSRELFPIVGFNTLFTLDGRRDLSLNAGLARGGIDPRYPVESGRLALTAGAALRDGPGGWSFAYLRATARLELVWRWVGGYHLDGTLLVDPRAGHVGGYGALGYTASVVPWLRGFVGVGRLPGDGRGARFLLGFEVDARVTHWLY
jgi:pimeloyl-ACP methyl ester carboxylesterase